MLIMPNLRYDRNFVNYDRLEAYLITNLCFLIVICLCVVYLSIYLSIYYWVVELLHLTWKLCTAKYKWAFKNVIFFIILHLKVLPMDRWWATFKQLVKNNQTVKNRVISRWCSKICKMMWHKHIITFWFMVLIYFFNFIV